MEKGIVYWITGLSGAGKTTIAKLLYEKLKANNNATVFLDGDVLREVFGNDLGYSLEDRRKSAMRNARLCKMLSDQGIDVICATISMFEECRKWNRENIEKYVEIYIKVSLEVLLQRDQKKLYSNTISGSSNNVLGMDLEFEEPEFPNLVIDNSGKNTAEYAAELIYELFAIKE